MTTTNRRESMYQRMIREHLARVGRVGTDARLVEGWMRSERGTLDALSPSTFRAEVLAAADCVAAAPTDLSERLAQSYGL